MTDLSKVPGRGDRRPDMRHKIIKAPYDIYDKPTGYLVAQLMGRETGEDDEGNPTFEHQSYHLEAPQGRSKYRYLKRRIDQIPSDRERRIMLCLQHYEKTIEQVADEIGVSDKYIYKVRDKHTWSPKARPDLYGLGGWPLARYDETKGFHIHG